MYTIVYSNGTPYWLIDGRMIPVIAGGAPEDEEGDTEVQDEEEGTEEEEPEPRSKAKPGERKSDKSKGQQQGKKSAAKPAPGPAPWEKDLTDRGLSDPRYAAYMREVVQPYITELEGRSAAQPEGLELFGGDQNRAQIAASVLNALDADPEAALREIANRLGIDLTAAPEDGNPDIDDNSLAPEGADDTTPEETPPPDPRSQWVDEQMLAQQEQEENAAYEAVLTAIEEQLPGFDRVRFSNLVRMYEGDLREAYTDYVQNWHKEPEPKPDAPPTLGGNGGRPPVEEAKRYETWDDFGSALDDFLAEERAAGRR